MDDRDGLNIKEKVKFAGAFIAWVIGSGFATGQEVLRFFASFGYFSYGIILLNLAGFIFLSQTIIGAGYEHKTETGFNHCKYFCGERLGTFYTWLIPVTLTFIMPVLISGAGATLQEYYGVKHFIGAAIMAAMVLCTYLIGFGRLIRIVSVIGPFIIIFSLLVGTITVARDFHNFGVVPEYEPVLRGLRSSPHWLMSSVLYLSLNFLGGSVYFTGLGMSAVNRKDALYGALFGVIAVVMAIMIMNSAILLNAGSVSSLAIPMLYLGNKISPVLGAVFSIILILGMFSSCSAMMWSVCSRFTRGGERGNRIFAILITIFTFLLSLFSFGELVGFFYPLVGYIGLVFIGCIMYKSIKKYRIRSHRDEAA